MGTVIRRESWGKVFKSPEALNEWMNNGRTRKERIATCLTLANGLFKNSETFISDFGQEIQDKTRHNLKLTATAYLKTAQGHARHEVGWKIKQMDDGEWKLITPESAEIISIKGDRNG